MKDLFYYIFYRASKFYKSWGENSNYYISGKFLLFLAICANILTLIGLFCNILKIRYSIEVIYVVCILFSVLSFFILNEKNNKIKGWLVIAYIIGSIILYFISLAFL